KGKDRMAFKEVTKLDPKELKGRKIGRVLTKLGKVTRDQVQEALNLQKTRKDQPLGQLLVGLGYVSPDDVLEALAGQAGMRFVSFSPDELKDDTLKALPAESARTYQVVPIQYDDASRRLIIAMKSPDNFRAVDDLRLLMGFKVEAVVARPELIDKVLQSRYREDGETISTLLDEAASSESISALQGRG